MQGKWTRRGLMAGGAAAVIGGGAYALKAKGGPGMILPSGDGRTLSRGNGAEPDTIDPHKAADFETYSRRWMEGGIIKRCEGEPLGYFLPKKGYGGPDNIAMTLIGFESLAAYEEYRTKLMADPDAKENVDFARKSGCILIEDRSYFYRVGGETGAV
jgi:hypothetical protein